LHILFFACNSFRMFGLANAQVQLRAEGALLPTKDSKA
jgi:hypothetical protein